MPKCAASSSVGRSVEMRTKAVEELCTSWVTSTSTTASLPLPKQMSLWAVTRWASRSGQDTMRNGC